MGLSSAPLWRFEASGLGNGQVSNIKNIAAMPFWKEREVAMKVWNTHGRVGLRLERPDLRKSWFYSGKTNVSNMTVNAIKVWKTHGSVVHVIMLF